MATATCMQVWGEQRGNTWRCLLRAVHARCKAEGRPMPTTCGPWRQPAAADLQAVEDAVRPLLQRWQGYERSISWRRRQDEMRHPAARARYVARRGSQMPAFVDVAAEGCAPAFTADPSRIAERVREFWATVWQDVDEPHPLEELLVQVLPERAPRVMRPVTAEDIEEALRRAKGVAGPDGWTLRELSVVRLLWGQLADIFNAMEDSATVPSMCLAGDVTLIPKSSGSVAYNEMRPITVLSVVWRLYAGVRLRTELFDWQESFLEGVPCRGCRLQSSTKDLVWPLAVMMERASWEGHSVHGAAYDLEKAFDQLPMGEFGVGWRLLERLGFPPSLRALLRDMYANVERRFRVRSFLSSPLRGVGLRGAMQGCAFSMLLMNVAVLPWMTMVRAGVQPDMWDRFADAAAVELGLQGGELAAARAAIVQPAGPLRYWGLRGRLAHSQPGK